ncbi:hypothetical protein K458DRAFT_482123 [Lentithecium fluviatile CBS 122367]|uniref:Uncharacterized protein n=1 Tax=Lentithecium fluviatile CBS 122367 TaxID=1168545 RepID=A0A6G1ICM2_9PLEO|nr:hypothetical protein K458DRAFT_482123 [Lentithecium fluviatile CBS 122367]
MSCQFPPDYAIADGVTYSQFNSSFADKLVCASTYLRPDPGGAMLPWLYTLFLLLFHLPACIIRAVRWESAQYLALGLALFNIAVTVQTYVSTKLRPSEILVWMPLTLMLDIGAMLQMVILILELPGHSVTILKRALDHPTLVTHALVALFAFLFGVMLLILQIYGLIEARKGMNTRDLTVNWCSPTFRDFALAVTTGNCDLYSVIESSSNGIGCIQLPASQQEDWLKGTVAALSVSLVFEVFDVLLVKLVGRNKKGDNVEVNGTRLRRPWLSMFGGALVLIILIYYGAETANHLPPGVTDVVWIYRKEPKADIGRVCNVYLKSPGLRGMIIGWTDGLFDSWGPIYHGKEVIKAIRKEL